MQLSKLSLIRLTTLTALLLFVLFNSSTKAQEYAVGADLSFLKQAEDNGFKFKENGEVKKGIEIFKNHGYNWIRLRLFHTPTQLPNNLEYTIATAKMAKEHGFKFLLDYHYSDTWADPAKQFIPKAWEGLSHETLVDSVYEYTRQTMIAFREAGVFPEMVQVGNEISNGMLWPNGKLPDNWDNLAELIQAGINGVYASCGNNPCPQIMIHIDKGGDKQFSKYWFDKLLSYGVDFDVMGQSYYPWWHGSILDLRETLNFMARAYQKEIIVVEAAYNFAPAEYIGKPAPFAESPEGQRQFLEEVNRVVLNVPNGLGVGVFWWEPALENKGFGYRTFFDADGNVQPVIEVFDRFTRY
ncbi:glycosyl hydrolase 53 family protein [Draconibacterium orientale]|uniref:glycoside hydrolase family 53 protein n=1 Tax=Draconibacterium orientale TaxID=1168034 RepID=UPI002ABDDB79|nr:glycosyl hydrolase 53 family protein [Draconibacterium orientale]